MIQTIEITQKIIKEATSTTGNDVMEIIDVIPFSKLGYRIINESLQLKELRFTSFITSVDSIPFPTFPLEASETETQLAVFNLEWQSPRIVMELLIKVAQESWITNAVYSLLNVFPLPYRQFEAGDYNLGNNSTIGVKFSNVGYGLLQGTDRVVIVADLIRKIQVEKISNGSPIDGTLIANTVKEVLPEDLSRQGITIFNNNNTDIYLDVLPTVSPSNFMSKIPGNSFYESSFNLKGKVYLLSSENITANIREF